MFTPFKNMVDSNSADQILYCFTKWKINLTVIAMISFFCAIIDLVEAHTLIVLHLDNGIFIELKPY